MIKKVIRTATAVYLILVVSINYPNWHRMYLRNSTQKSVVKITNKLGNSGGTGFHIKSPSGKVYILTNGHVCELSQDGIIFITDDYNRQIPRQIIEESDITDLCLIEALPDYKGYLTVGSESELGDIVYPIGHPALMPTTMSQGEVIGFNEISVLTGIILSQEDADKCSAPKNKIEKAETFLGTLEFCTIHIKAGMTNSQILPGSSGSPVVNYWGHLTGVIFAGNAANWGFYVTLKDVKEFLTPY